MKSEDGKNRWREFMERSVLIFLDFVMGPFLVWRALAYHSISRIFLAYLSFLFVLFIILPPRILALAHLGMMGLDTSWISSLPTYGVFVHLDRTRFISHFVQDQALFLLESLFCVSVSFTTIISFTVTTYIHGCRHHPLFTVASPLPFEERC